MKRKNPNIGIATFPISEAGVIPLLNLVNILCSISEEVHLITGDAGFTAFENNNKVRIYPVEHMAGARFSRIINYTKTQLKISNQLLRLRKNVDCWIFFIGAEGLVLPILTAKLLRKKVVIASAGTGFKPTKASNSDFAFLLALLQTCTYCLADRIILYSHGLIEKQDLQKYKNKIFIARHHAIDLEKFKMRMQLNERDYLVGHIGRLSKEKGTLNFVKAVPYTLKEKHEINFLIGGDGQLRDEIEKFLVEYNLNEKVKLVGWISHDNLPQYLNKLKLIVLPSYYEGLPNIMLEAMACGTPVLATPVGAIPDFIKDCETGFIMENNTPECIAQNVIRVLNHPNLKQIADKGRALVEKEFTFEKAVEGYREILNKL